MIITYIIQFIVTLIVVYKLLHRTATADNP